MKGNFIDTIRLGKSKLPNNKLNMQLIETDYGRLRVLDTKGNKPVIISVPDGPNVIEHHQSLIEKLSVNFRVICFEFPGLGFSFPTMEHDYSFERSAKILLQLMEILRIDRAALCFSCSNGFYAIKATEIAPERFTYLFLTQTPSVHSMKDWTDLTIPKILTYPIIGQLINSFTEKKLARIWYKTALPKSTDKTEYERIAFNSLNKGGCFCLSSLVQGLIPESNSSLKQIRVPSTQIWGKKDYSHRKTDNKTILEHLPNCEIIEFDNCGHFSELESTDNYVKLVNERLNAFKL
jgi:pimeloyl-ACP methyl ester carboxylesterase